MKLPLLAVTALVLCGCQTGEKPREWRSPEYFGATKRSVAVVVAAYRPEMRRQYEEAVAASLRARGVSAKTTYASVPLELAQSNKQAALARIGPTEAILVIRPADATLMGALTVDPSNSGAVLQPWQNWFDFFSADKAFASRPVGAGGGTMGIYAALFEAPAGRLLWSATGVHTFRSGSPEAGQLASSVVGRLQKSALIP